MFEHLRKNFSEDLNFQEAKTKEKNYNNNNKNSIQYWSNLSVISRVWRPCENDTEHDTITACSMPRKSIFR